MTTTIKPTIAAHPALSVRPANPAVLRQRGVRDQFVANPEPARTAEVLIRSTTITDQMPTESADKDDEERYARSMTALKESRSSLSTSAPRRTQRDVDNRRGISYESKYDRDLAAFGSKWSPQLPNQANLQGAGEEEALVSDISALWSSADFRNTQIRKLSKERSDFRIRLEERLHRYKAILVGSGRSGRWSSFLRDIDMPRATADRYVQRRERSLELAKGNCLSESISPPTADEIAKMVARLKPKLQRVLTTNEAVDQFVSLLRGSLELS